MSSENVDRLSMLPEEIVSHILSLMCTKIAVRTSVLSKRWRYAWMSVTNLDFYEYYTDDIDSISKFVERVLAFRKPPKVNLFRLRLHRCYLPESCVPELIDMAVMLNVRELDIQYSQLDLPSSILTCKTLTKLRLILPCQSLWEVPCQVNLPCLKTLDILVYHIPFVNALKLFSGCPILESLSFQVEWREWEEDYIFTIPTLKRLKLTLAYETSFTSKVVLHLPNLEYLFVGKDIMYSFFVMENVSSLVEASVLIQDVLELDHRLDELFVGLNGVKFLSIKHVICPYYRKSFTLTLPIFPNITQLKLKVFWHSRVIHQFLESSPELKHLCIEKQMSDEPSWIEPTLVPACFLTNLTTIKFSKCEGWKCDIQLLEYMLGNAEVLKTVTVTWDNLSIEKEARLCEQLLAAPKASQNCEIHFRGS